MTTAVEASVHPGGHPRVHALHHREEVMGTIVTIDLYTEDETPIPRSAAHVGRARAVLHRADETFSTWKPGSPLSRLRRGECTLAEMPPEVVEVFEACRAIRVLTDGWFDPWAMPGGVDPTGYVKGWAAHLALDEFRGLDVNGVIVNAAGDIATFGGPVGEEAFRTGIVRPDDAHRLAAVVELRGCLATSGEAQRGAHLFNPFTHEYAGAVASASVAGPDLGLCDALATALSVGGHDVMVLIDKIEGYEAMTIDASGSMRATPGFPFVRD